jgi:trk system potassium uptake protein TrkA
VLNHVLGYNTLEIEYLAGGALQVRRTGVGEGSPLAGLRLAEDNLPKGCLVLALVSNGHVTVPTGDDCAQVGDDALVIGTPEAVEECERRISGHAQRHGLVVIAGGGATAQAALERLEGQAKRLTVIESNRQRAEELAARFPRCHVIHSDAADVSVLAAEGVGQAKHFIALTGHDETNLMACLLAQELGVKQITALVQRSETSTLWQKVALIDVVSPRKIAAEWIQSYIENNYEPHIVAFENGAAEFVQRKVYPQSAVANVKLRDLEIPQGLIVAAMIRNGRASTPRGDDRLEVGDDVVLFVGRAEAGMAQLLFPGPDSD